jgi:hypothetical protein
MTELAFELIGPEFSQDFLTYIGVSLEDKSPLGLVEYYQGSGSN